MDKIPPLDEILARDALRKAENPRRYARRERQTLRWDRVETPYRLAAQSSHLNKLRWSTAKAEWPYVLVQILENERARAIAARNAGAI